MPASTPPDTALSEGICLALACPACGEKITIRESQASCARCDCTYPVRSGVVDFRLAKGDYYDNPLKRSDMQQINEQFSRHPWSETLGQFLQLSGDLPLWLDKLVDEGRFAWKIYLGLNSGGQLLDYGCKLGTSTKNLAPHFAKTYALEQTLENAVFTKKRMDLSNAGDDITVLTCDRNHRIPMQNGCIDVVNADQVLERAGDDNTAELESDGVLRRFFRPMCSMLGQGKTRHEQLAILREMSRVLKSDGQLFMRCRNQLDYKQFTDNSGNGEKGTASLVRNSFAILLSMLTVLRSAPHDSYTLWGYRRLLKKAGFSRIGVIALFEDDDLSEEMRPGPGKFPLWKPLPYSNLKKRIKQSPYLSQNFVIIASKGEYPTQRIEAQIAEAIARELGASTGDFHSHHYLVSRKGKLIFRANCAGQELFVRVPLTRQATAAESNNHEILDWLQVHRPTLSFLFPRPLLNADIQQQISFAETGVPGKPLVSLLKQQHDPAQCLSIGLDFLVRLNNDYDKVTPPLTRETYERLVLAPLENISTLVTAEQADKLKNYFAVQLENKRIPVGLMHGDYGARNILLENGSVSGLIDWEDADKEGLPALDAICLVFSCYSRLGEGFKAGLSLVEMARRADYFSEYLPALDDYYRRTGVDEGCHEGLVLLYWVRVISHRISLGRTIGSTSNDLMVQRIVQDILKNPNS